MNVLVGYTGFVGSNLYASGEFDAVFNSKNIEEAYGLNPEVLVYAGLRAEKYLANNEPEKDMALIKQAEDNIKKINPKKLILISTVDVFKEPLNVDENSEIDVQGLHAYGYNRYQLELWVRKHYPDALIIRLPGLFGKNIKKNFIYDYINLIPYMLKEDKYKELVLKDSEIEEYYELQENGFYKVKVSEADKEKLKIKFKKLGFSALNFTDSRNVYQFYNLGRLWDDMQIVLQNKITLWHPATEAVSIEELYYYLEGKEFKNEILENPITYDFQTIYASIFGKGEDKYIYTKEEVMSQIKQFVEG